MKIDKKGFTLMELLGVIIILSLLLLLVVPNIVNSVKNSQKDIDELTEDIVYDATNLYISDNESYYYAANGTEFCISLNDLIDESYLKSPIKYKNLDDISNTHSIKVTYNDGYNYKLVNNDTCPKVICKRATTLHEEICSVEGKTSCSSYGNLQEKLGKTIKIGSLGTSGTLTGGDAFDCDVNGDGTYDSETERFYYITDLKEHKNYAVLLYYNNTVLGEPNNTNSSYIEYNSSGKNNLGPVTAITNLPTISQWKNVSLSNSNRQITTDSNQIITSSGNISIFDYSGYAARLLTYQEVKSLGSYNSGNYCMLENSYHFNTSLLLGFWVETPLTSSTNVAYTLHAGANGLYSIPVTQAQVGVRPVIEVPKYRIEY